MPTTTFEHLNNLKKQRIEQALLIEFSHYSINDAQVARIVKKAEIARGAFYKYFDNLEDAYQYLLNKAFKELHNDLSLENFQDSSFLIDKMKKFIAEANSSSYFDLFRMHFKSNEQLLHPFISTIKFTKKEWIIFTLSHETLREIFLDYPHHTFYLNRFANIIQNMKE